MSFSAPVLSLGLAALLAAPPLAQSAEPFPFEVGDRVCLIGNALAERMQHHGHLEARLQTLLPDRKLSFRNLGFSADELTVRQRTQGFGSQDEWLERCHADVVFAFFGFNESFAGEEGLADFGDELRRFVAHITSTTYNGEAPPRLVLFSSIPQEDIGNPHLPERAAANARISAYNEMMAIIAAETGVRFVDIFEPLAAPFATGMGPFTINGIHLKDYGNAMLADVIGKDLTGRQGAPDATIEAAVRDAVLDKNHYWFNRYRATDGYNVYGGRSSLKYTDDLSNYTVLQQELTILDAMCEQRDGRIQALAAGDAATPVDVDLPERIAVKTNKTGKGEGGAHTFLSGDAAIAEMTPDEGLAVALFADESMFPELVNPVQMAWDPLGRLWVICWATYPHWAPGDPMDDRLLVLEDKDGDGRADSCIVFANDLHNPTGLEFWNNGVFVACAPDMLFLEDLDGDGVCDRRERVLHGLSSGDTHHASNSLVVGPDGALYFQEGVFHQTQIETVHGPVRSRDACLWRFEPATWRVERYVAYGFANPHGHVFDRWGQDFMTDGTGNVNYYALPFSGHLDQPKKHSGYFPFFKQRSRPCAGTEILSSQHFPADWQGNYLICNVIGFQGIFRYQVSDDGSGFKADELSPVVHSRDPNFRPSDLEVGPDGALYFLDWHNPIIGHMQHHLRDPSRDRRHGRVYRVTVAGSPTIAPRPVAGLTIRQLMDLLTDPNDRVRYRARLELSGRDKDAVVKELREWTFRFQPNTPDLEHHRLEALWVQQMLGVLDEGQMVRLLVAKDPRARAAATRVLRQMRDFTMRPLTRLAVHLDDPHPRVRLEALVGMSFFPEARAAERALKVLEQPMDRFLEYALTETLKQLEPYWRAEIASGRPFATDQPAGLSRLLKQLRDDELRGAAPCEPVYREMLRRHGLARHEVRHALEQLAVLSGRDPGSELIDAIERADGHDGDHADHLLMNLFAAVEAVPKDARPALSDPLARLSIGGRRASTRRLATAARMRADGDIRPAFAAAGDSLERQGDLLDAAPFLRDEELGEALYPEALARLDARPGDGASSVTHGRYVRIELPGKRRTLTLAEVEVHSDGRNVAPEGSATQSSVRWNGEADHAIDGNKSGRFGDGGQTHTAENSANPWWELDLGGAQSIDSVAIWNRTDGDLGSRLEGFVVKVMDAERRLVFEAGPDAAPSPTARFDLDSPDVRLRRKAARAIGALAKSGVRTREAIDVLVLRFSDPDLRGTIVSSLRSLPVGRWPASAASTLAAQLGTLFETSAPDAFDGVAGRELLAFADELAPKVQGEVSDRLKRLRARVGPQVILIRPIIDTMLYDVTEFTVVVGRPVELVFDNVDIMPHNVVVTAPGHLATVGLAAEEMAQDPTADARGYVPDRPEVLFASRLLQSGESQTLKFDAPAAIGDYPYVCTFPGHWVRMNGVMRVVADADTAHVAKEQARKTDLTVSASPSAASGRKFVKAWTLADLTPHLSAADGHDATRGHAVMKTASCLACHKTGDDEGAAVGPDLREMVGKYDREALLRQILEPSAEITEEYVTEIFITFEGTVVAGKVLAEEGATIRIQTDPYELKDPVEIRKRSVRLRQKSDVSTMPLGLLSTFERGDILDMLAYLESLKPAEGD